MKSAYSPESCHFVSILRSVVMMNDNGFRRIWSHVANMVSAEETMSQDHTFCGQ